MGELQQSLSDYSLRANEPEGVGLEKQVRLSTNK